MLDGMYAQHTERSGGALNYDAHTACYTVFVQQGRSAEPALRAQVLDDNRLVGEQGVPAWELMSASTVAFPTSPSVQPTPAANSNSSSPGSSSRILQYSASKVWATRPTTSFIRTVRL